MAEGVRPGLHLHVDGAAGAAGDMFLGALLDLGVPQALFEEALDRIGLGRERLRVERVVKHGLAAVNVTIDDRPEARPRTEPQGRLQPQMHPGPQPQPGPQPHPGPEPQPHPHPGPHPQPEPQPHAQPEVHLHAHSDARGPAHSDAHGHGHSGAHGHAHSDAHGHGHSGAHGHGHSGAHGHGHSDAHGHAYSGAHGHGHTLYRDIVARIRGAGLEPEVERRALDIFARIARAEARLHGTSVDEVAFHEVGAIDSIADVVGAAVGLAHLSPCAVTASPVALGHGTVRTAHGLLPVPSPAALEILREAGALTTSGGVARELCTPTGAAILAHAVTAWAPMPTLTPRAVGHGAGDAELEDRPNVLRLVLGEPGAPPQPAVDETLYRIEANVDDMTPEVCGHAGEVIAAAGAVDVWWTPITMKKSRPALLLQALAPASALDAVVRAILTETTSIGVRFDRVARRALAREHVTVETPYGPIPVKLARLDQRVVNAAPEYEACREAARRHGVPLKDVLAAAQAAWLRTRS